MEILLLPGGGWDHRSVFGSLELRHFSNVAALKKNNAAVSFPFLSFFFFFSLFSSFSSEEKPLSVFVRPGPIRGCLLQRDLSSFGLPQPANISTAASPGFSSSPSPFDWISLCLGVRQQEEEEKQRE